MKVCGGETAKDARWTTEYSFRMRSGDARKKRLFVPVFLMDIMRITYS
jgi:hypothetical protein